MYNPFSQPLDAHLREPQDAQLVPLSPARRQNLLWTMVMQVVGIAYIVIFVHRDIVRYVPALSVFPPLRMALPWLLVLAALLWLLPRVVATVTEATDGTAQACATQVLKVWSVTRRRYGVTRYYATFASLGTLELDWAIYQRISGWGVGRGCTVVYSARLARVWEVQERATTTREAPTAPRARRRWPAV